MGRKSKQTAALWTAGIALWVALQAAVMRPAAAQTMDMRGLLESFGLQVTEEEGRLVVSATLKQVLELAQQRNTALASARMGETIAQSSLEAARNRFNPTLTNSVNFNRFTTPVSPFPGLGTANDPFLILGGTDTTVYSSSFRKPTESGIEYGLTYAEQRARNLGTSISKEGESPTELSKGNDLWSSALTGSVNIPIGQDFGSDLNNIPVRRGELGLHDSRLEIRGRELDLLAQTADTYWNLVAAQENLRVQADSVKLSERLLRENRQRLQAGVLSPFDVQAAETQLAREREQLLVARSEVLRIQDLVRAILDLEAIDIGMRPLDAPQMREVRFDQPQLLEKVYSANPNLRRLENRRSSNQLDLEEAENQDRSNVDLELFYTFKGYSRDAFGGTSSFSESDLAGYGATVTWTLPLFDVRTRETIRQRKLERQRLELDINSLKAELSVRLQSVLRQVQLAKEEVETTRISRQLAEEQLKNEIERFKVGESTSFRVSEVQQDTTEAKVREILARLRFERNYLSLLVLTGDIYERYGITPEHP